MKKVMLDIGIILYILVTLADKITGKLPLSIYIPAAIIGIILIFVGALELPEKKKNQQIKEKDEK